MNFVTGYVFIIDWKSNSYNIILFVIDCLIKIVHYKSVKMIIDITNVAKVINNILVKHYNLSELIIGDWGLLFIF